MTLQLNDEEKISNVYGLIFDKADDLEFEICMAKL